MVGFESASLCLPITLTLLSSNIVFSSVMIENAALCRPVAISSVALSLAATSFHLSLTDCLNWSGF